MPGAVADRCAFDLREAFRHARDCAMVLYAQRCGKGDASGLLRFLPAEQALKAARGRSPKGEGPGLDALKEDLPEKRVATRFSGYLIHGGTTNRGAHAPRL